MKILHAITGLSVGGAENMLAKLLENAEENDSRLEPVVLSLMAPGRMADRIRETHTPIFSLDMPEGQPSPVAIPRLFSAMRTIRPDLIHGWMHHGNLAATVGSRMLPSRPPVIWNIRHSLVDIRHEKPLTRLVLRLTVPLSANPAAIIYNSHTAARQYEQFGYQSHKSIVIPNGFDCQRFQPRPNARTELCRIFGIDEKAIIVGMVARMHPMKDPENLVEAVRRARLQGHDIHLLIVGKDADTPKPSLAGAIAVLPADRVSLVGVRDDVADWLSGLDMLALPSAWGEAFPNVIGEAMACGVPCVATDVGDCRWIIQNHGRVVPPRDPEALGEALAWLAGMKPDERRQIGEAARARVIANFSIQEIVRAYDGLYDRILGRIPKVGEQVPSGIDARVSACAG